MSKTGLGLPEIIALIRMLAGGGGGSSGAIDITARQKADAAFTKASTNNYTMTDDNAGGVTVTFTGGANNG